MKTGNDVSLFKADINFSIATIGNFDGVHVGHQKILSLVKERALKLGGQSLVITFEPHPSEVLYPARGVSRICNPSKKIELIKKADIENMLIVPFTLSFATKGPRAFVEEILVALKVRELYVGHDFTFGSARSGNVSALTNEGKLLGFETFEIGEVKIENQLVRSTRIRELLSKGDVENTALLLNRYHSLSGIVVKGEGRGMQLGFPTANLGTIEETVPSAGVYATLTSIDGKVYKSATHLGVIPTFDVDVPGVETHIFEFDKEVTGKHIEIYFVKKIRGTTKFDSPEELKKQIKIDCDIINEVLKNASAKTYLS